MENIASVKRARSGQRAKNMIELPIVSTVAAPSTGAADSLYLKADELERSHAHSTGSWRGIHSARPCSCLLVRTGCRCERAHAGVARLRAARRAERPRGEARGDARLGGGDSPHLGRRS